MTRSTTQRGATLLVTLVLLVLIGLAAMVSFASSARNVRIVGNMQLRGEVLAAAQQLLEHTISNGLFTRDPAAVAADPKPVDIDGDGVADYSALLQPAPSCVRMRPVRTLDLDPGSGDAACLGSGSYGAGSDFGAAAQPNSLCNETTWNVTAVVTDAATGAQATVHQGVAVRIVATDASNACP